MTETLTVIAPVARQTRIDGSPDDPILILARRDGSTIRQRLTPADLDSLRWHWGVVDARWVGRTLTLAPETTADAPRVRPRTNGRAAPAAQSALFGADAPTIETGPNRSLF